MGYGAYSQIPGMIPGGDILSAIRHRTSQLRGNPPQQLYGGPNSLFQIPGLMGSRTPESPFLPGRSVDWEKRRTGKPKAGIGDMLTKGGGLLAMLGGPVGAIGLGLTAVGGIAGLFGKDPYKELESRTRKRFGIMRALASRRVAGQSASSIQQARQRLAGSGLSDSMAFEQIARGYKADYGRQLSDTHAQLMAEQERELADIEAGRAEYRGQRRTAMAGMMGPGLDLLLGSIDPRYRGFGG